MNHRVSKQILSILLCFVMLLSLLPTTALAADTTTIDTINIKGITAPVAGATPDASGVTTDTAGIKIKNPTWRDSDGRYSVSQFVAGGEYKLAIGFEAESGYTIANNVNVTLNISDYSCLEIIGPFHTASGDNGIIYMGYKIPAAGAPTTYTVTVNGGTASPAGPNTSGTAVTVTAGAAPAGKEFYKWEAEGISLTADDAKNKTLSFTMPANNVTLTARYVSIIEAANATVAAPVAGGTPSFTLVSDDEPKYTATVESWILLDGGSEIELTASDKFESGKDYKINIRFTAKEGYQFDSDCTFTLNEKSTQAYVIGDPTSRRYYFNDVPAAGAATHTVSFDANGGTGTMAPATGISGEYTLPACTFTAPSGKQFKAWSVGGVEKAVGDKITVTADTTVTAVWETIPAGHTCDIKSVAKVNPSCTEGGKEAYYKCEGCGKFYEDALGTKEITDLAAWGNLAKLGHTESDWKSDKDNHWKECTVAACGVIIENSKAAHADANNDGKCDVCEYNVGKTSTNPGNKPSDDVQNPQTGDNSMMWLWIALLFVSGFGVVTTTVYTKKRKSVK